MKKFTYAIVYRTLGEVFCRETFILARSRSMALRKLSKQLNGISFEYDICKDYE